MLLFMFQAKALAEIPISSPQQGPLFLFIYTLEPIIYFHDPSQRGATV